MPADQNLSLGTIFKGEVDRSFEQAIRRLRSVLTGLASEQARAARTVRSGMQGGRLTLYDDFTNLQKIMGQFPDTFRQFRSALRTVLQGVTDPIHQKAVAGQMITLEKNLGKVVGRMEQVSAGSGRRLAESFDRVTAHALTTQGSLKFLNNQFVANDNDARRFLQTQQLADVVSKKYTDTVTAHAKALSDIRVQSRAWLQQFAGSPAVYKQAQAALLQVEKAASKTAAQMISMGRDGEAFYRKLPKQALATQILGDHVKVLGNRFAAADFEGKKFLEKLELGGVYTPQFTAKLRELGGTSDFVGRQIGRVRGGIERLAAAFKVTASYAIAGGAMMALRSAVIGGKTAIYDFNQGLANLAAITGATTPEIQLMGEEIKKVASTTKFTATEVSDAMVVLGQAGLTAGESVDAIRAVALLATGTLEKMETTADLLTTTLRSFNMEASESGRVADVMANAINKSKLTVEKFRTAFNYIAPVAHLAGLSLEETSAAMEILANAGLRGSTIGTSFRQMLQRLIAPTADLRAAFTAAGADFRKLNPQTASLAEIFDELSKVVPNANKAFELFGLRAAPAVAAFVSAGRTGFETFLKDLYEVGAAEAMAEKQMKGLAAQAANLASRMKNLAIEVGEGGLATAFDLFYQAMRPALELLTAFAKNEIGRVIIAFVGLTAAVTGLYQAIRFLRVVLLASLVPDKTISDIKKLQVTGEKIGGVFVNLGRRLLQFGRFMGRHPFVIAASVISGAVYALKSWNDSIQRSYELSQQQGIMLDKQIKQLEGYGIKIDQVKGSNVAFEGTLKRLIKDFPDLEKELKEVGNDAAKINEIIERYKDQKVWESIKNHAEQIVKLNEVTERQIWLQVAWDRLKKGPVVFAQEMKSVVEDVTWGLNTIAGAIEGVSKKMTKDVVAVFKATPIGKLFGDTFDVDYLKKEVGKDLNAVFGQFVANAKKLVQPLGDDVSEAMKRNRASFTYNLREMSKKLQEFGFTGQSSIEDIAIALKKNLRDVPKAKDMPWLDFTDEQFTALAEMIKEKWQEIEALAKTFTPLEFSKTETEDRMKEQKAIIDSLGQEWSDYYHQVEKMKVPISEVKGGWIDGWLMRYGKSLDAFVTVHGGFADRMRAALVETAIEAKKEMDKMEEDAKTYHKSSAQIDSERIAIKRKHLQKYIELLDKERDMAGKITNVPLEAFKPAVKERLPFQEWARELYRFDVTAVSEEFHSDLKKVYDLGLQLVRMRDLPKFVQQMAQGLQWAMGKPGFGPDDWVFPTLFSEFGVDASRSVKKAGDDVEEAFAYAANKYEMGVDLIRAVSYAESSFIKERVSEKGAKGLMQLMPDTAKDMKVDIDNWFENVQGGTKYLKSLLLKYDGDLYKTLVAYNQGPNRIGITEEAHNFATKVLMYIGQLRPEMVSKYLGPFRDLARQVETEAARFERIKFAPKLNWDDYQKEHTEALEKMQKEHEEYAKWADIAVTESAGQYGTLWDKFLKRELNRISAAQPFFEEALTKLMPQWPDIKEDAMLKGTEEQFEATKVAVLNSVDALTLYRQVLKMTSRTEQQVNDTTLAQLEELKKEFPAYVKLWEQLEAAIRATWAELQGEHEVQVKINLKKNADELAYYMDNLRGEFNRGILNAEEYAEKLDFAYEEGFLSYEEWMKRKTAVEKSGWENFKFGIKQAQNEIETWGEMWQRVGEGIIEILSDGITQALEDYIDQTKTAKEAFKDFAISTLKWLGQILMKAALMRAFSWVFGGGEVGGIVGANPNTFAAVTGHGGAVVGQDELPIAKFHKGYSGLAADEIPAILKKNETVFTPGQMKALGEMINQGQGGASISVPVSISGIEQGRLAGRLRVNIEEVVRRTLREEMR